MAGKEDEGEAGGRGLAERHMAALEGVIADCVEALVATPLKPADLLAIERKARSAGVIARAIKLITGLKTKPRKAGVESEKAAEMSEDMTGHDEEMDPAEVAALRAELASRLDRLRTFIDRKRMAGEPDGAGAEGADRRDARAA